MSTRKSRMIEGCADCGAPDASWASINRGVLICEECCSVHRSLGRHISQIRSLKRGHWSATLSAMVQQLANSSANNIWEHTLLDPTQNKHGRRKPGPKDPVHPNKADFIRKKYQFLAFTNKHNDGDEDLSRQLHSCVRTNNLETCLRLLSKGADPNFFHHEKGNCPIHVAAQAGQMSQIEILVVYGADPGILDSCGKTPIDYALSESHLELAERLVECQYELTDRLAYFLCLRTPDHRTGAHFIIPEIGDSNLDLSELAKQAKKKLQNLPDALFEELAKDIYDEVDRRENNGIWNNRTEHLGSMNNINSDRQTIPFLPVNPEFSTTRNQGRQKLAHLNAREFATLIIDILIDAKRRHLGMAVSIMSPKDPEPLDMEWNSYDVDDGIEESDPIYDYVPEDDDISTAETQSVKSIRLESHTTATSNGIISESDLDDHVSIRTLTDASQSTNDYKQVHQKLLESQSQIQQLKSSKKSLQYEIKMLQNMMCQVQEENKCLKDELSHQSRSPRNIQLSAAHSQPVLTTMHPQALSQQPSGYQHTNDAGVSSHCQTDKENVLQPQVTSSRSIQLLVTEPLQNGASDDDTIQIRRLSRGGQRPKSMIEPWDQQKQETNFGTLSSTSAVSEVNLSSILRGVGNISSLTDESDMMEQSDTSAHSDSELPLTNADNDEITSNQGNASILEDTEATSVAVTDSNGAEAEMSVMPSQEDLKARTEQISKTIRQLMFLAQQSKHDSFQACAEKITEAVDEIVSIFPKVRLGDSYSENIPSEGAHSAPDGIHCALALLQASSRQLQADCQACSLASSTSTELQIRTKHVIQHAYDITKAARELVAMLQSKVFKNS